MNDKNDALLKWKIIALLLLVACIIVGALLIKERLDETHSEKIINGAIAYINSHSTSTATLNGIERNSLNIGKLYSFSANIDNQSVNYYISSDGKYLIPSNSLISLTKTIEPQIPAAISDKNQVEAIGGFRELKDVDICLENGKPSVYFFGLKTSEDSAWEYPIFNDIASQFGDSISFHDNYLSENGLNKDTNIFLNYSNGSVPVLVIGCKYYRVGSGKSLGEVQEKQALTKILCETTGNKPSNICSK